MSPATRHTSRVEPCSEMVVIGLFLLVEDSGAPFGEAGLEKCKNQRAAEDSDA
jgi:hypothetical protein